jgi:putative spermidine/putrescine transport system permease protein
MPSAPRSWPDDRPGADPLTLQGPAAAPAIAVAAAIDPQYGFFIGVHLMMIQLALINTYLGVILAQMIISIPYATTISMAFYRGISRDMEDLARTLGCSNKKLFLKVMAPLMMPGILLSLSICFVLSFSEYFGIFSRRWPDYYSLNGDVSLSQQQ